jgi:hypothetical protein
MKRTHEHELDEGHLSQTVMQREEAQRELELGQDPEDDEGRLSQTLMQREEAQREREENPEISESEAPKKP